ncbi:hypothetical protein WHL03_14435, partial [Staphylococcus aureus]|uniref:hypothetical protein n=1 Tax=Staphylococcus aureus TaxID=1280 RepID=UPI0039BE88A8
MRKTALCKAFLTSFLLRMTVTLTRLASLFFTSTGARRTSMFKFFRGIFSNDVSIDLGTANTLIYVRG